MEDVLDIAEIELNVMTRQCLSRRIENIGLLRRELTVCETERNQNEAKIQWHFRTGDAKLSGLSYYAHVSNCLLESNVVNTDIKMQLRISLHKMKNVIMTSRIDGMMMSTVAINKVTDDDIAAYSMLHGKCFCWR